MLALASQDKASRTIFFFLGLWRTSRLNWHTNCNALTSLKFIHIVDVVKTIERYFTISTMAIMKSG